MNTRLVKPEDFPKTFDDLLDPKYTGKIVWRRNNLTGATGFVGNVLVTMGEEKGMEYLRKLARQRLITVSISDRAVLDQIIAGEYAMTIAMTNHNVEISRKQGAPVAWSPLETAMIFSEQMGLTTLSTRPNAGRLFVEYALSREGQTVFQKAGYIPTHPAVPPLEPKLLPAGGRLQGQRVHARLRREEPQAVGRNRRAAVPLTFGSRRRAQLFLRLYASRPGLKLFSSRNCLVASALPFSGSRKRSASLFAFR